MTGFDKNWSNQNRATAGDKLKEALTPQGPLKPRIETAVNKLQLQTSKLEAMITKLNERDASLFRRVVDAMQRHDADSAKVLSNELAEVRKISKTLGQAKMALEQVSMRLSTIHDLGDAMVALGIVASLRGARGDARAHYDATFHLWHLLMEICPNRTVSDIAAMLWRRSIRFRGILLALPESQKDVAAFGEALVELARRRDGDGARRATADLLARVRNTLLEQVFIYVGDGRVQRPLA